MVNKKRDFADSYEQLCWKHASRQYESNALLIAKYELFAKTSSIELQVFIETRLEWLHAEQEKLRLKYPRYLK